MIQAPRTGPTRLLHLSDPHIASAPGWGQFNAHRLLGRINWLFSRRFRHRPETLRRLISQAIGLAPTVAVVTGDIGQLGLPQELQKARQVFAPLREAGIPVLFTPGNHDCYGGGLCPEFSRLQDELRGNLEIRPSGLVELADMDLLLLNQAVPTPIFRAWGRMDGHESPEAERLRTTTQPERPRVAAGHFPLLCPDGTQLAPHIRLKNDRETLDFLRELKVGAYLCGHIHARYTRALFPGCTQYCAGSASAQTGGFFLLEAKNGGVKPVDVSSCE